MICLYYAIHCTVLSKMVHIHNEAYSALSEQLWLAENFMFCTSFSFWRVAVWLVPSLIIGSTLTTEVILHYIDR